MDTEAGNKRKYRGKSYLGLAAFVIVAIALIPLVTGGCDSGDVKTVVTGASSGTENWNGANGAQYNCEYGGNLHWVLTSGGSTLVSGTLHVTFADNSTASIPGSVNGNGSSLFFYSNGTAEVTSAYADYTYDGTINGEVKLTISDSTCNTTTTEGASTTLPPPYPSSTTTTVVETTTTDFGGLTSTTVSETTTTAGNETTTTAGETTTTAVSGLTSTTIAGETTTTVAGGLTTAGRIDTGGGGTAGPNAMLWLIVSLLGALAVALGGSAIWSGLKHKSNR